MVPYNRFLFVHIWIGVYAHIYMMSHTQQRRTAVSRILTILRTDGSQVNALRWLGWVGGWNMRSGSIYTTCYYNNGGRM